MQLMIPECRLLASVDSSATSLTFLGFSAKPLDFPAREAHRLWGWGESQLGQTGLPNDALTASECAALPVTPEGNKTRETSM